MSGDWFFHCQIQQERFSPSPIVTKETGVWSEGTISALGSYLKKVVHSKAPEHSKQASL